MRGNVVISWLFVIAWMGVIFMFSSMNGEESTDLSDSGIRDVVSSAISITNEMGITHDDGNQKYFIEKMVIYLNYPVRKCAHMFLYFVLGILMFMFLRFKTNHPHIIAIIGCYIYACSDEIHQLFVDGRGTLLSDTFVDLAGGIAGIMAISIILLVWYKIQRKEKSYAEYHRKLQCRRSLHV